VAVFVIEHAGSIGSSHDARLGTSTAGKSQPVGNLTLRIIRRLTRISMYDSHARGQAELPKSSKTRRFTQKHQNHDSPLRNP